MSGNTFGTVFRITTWGESHGGAVGVVIDGCPAKIKITAEEIQKELDRRRPGQSNIVTPRQESDEVHIMSGVFKGKTIGSPVSLLVYNKDADSSKYENLKNTFRPSHADFTYENKYGIRNWQGGGRASARETIGRVAAGVLAAKILPKNMEIISYVKKVKNIESSVDLKKLKAKDIDTNDIRCPDQAAAKKMITAIKKAKAEGDTLGGIIECVIRNCPIGLGSPVFDKLDARLAQAMLSLPATKGFEIGSGFAGTTMKGSEHNDIFQSKNGKISTKTNHSGGVQGGISNGQDIVFRVAFKPVSTIFKEQKTVNNKGENTKLRMAGRHDPCVLPRAVPIVEAMTKLILADEFLLQKLQS